MNLAVGYATKLSTLSNGKLQVTPEAIIQHIAKNGEYVPNFYGQNTGISTSQLKNGVSSSFPAMVARVPAIIDGIR